MASSPNLWPRSTQCLCWHCAHTFTTVPVFIPSYKHSAFEHLYLEGNFCSWNCVKAYVFQRQKGRGQTRGEKAMNQETSHQLIALLAFLTVYRPQHCPQSRIKHTCDCPCLEGWDGISIAPPKESLIAFGGTMSIKSYRSNFLMVVDHDWISYCFRHPHELMLSNLHSITATKRLRSFTYSMASGQHEQQQTDKSKTTEKAVMKGPILHKNPNNQKSLF